MRAQCHHRHFWIPKHKHPLYFTYSVGERVFTQCSINRFTVTLSILFDHVNSVCHANICFISIFFFCIQSNAFLCLPFTTAHYNDNLPCLDFSCGLNDFLGSLDVSVLSHVHHSSPTGSNDAPWARAGH